MGSDRLDAQLEPLAEFLLILITLLVVAAITSYLLSKGVARRKQAAHNKLSASRRGKDSGIDLFAKESETEASGGHGSGRRSKSKSRKSFNLVGLLNDLAFKLDPTRRRGRSKSRRGKRRRSGSSGHSRIDLMKAPEAAPDPQRDHPAP